MHTGAPEQPDSLPRLETEGNILEYRGQLRRVLYYQVLDFDERSDSVARWPICRGTPVFDNGGWFLRKVQVFCNTFDRAVKG